MIYNCTNTQKVLKDLTPEATVSLPNHEDWYVGVDRWGYQQILIDKSAM